MTAAPDPFAALPTPARDYLAKLDAALQPLPALGRTEVVREIASHLAERAEQGRLEEALAALGAPHDFARPYVEDHDLTNALNRSTPLALLLTIAGRGARSLMALTTGFVALVMYLFAIAFAAIAVLKPITPANVGLWRTDHGFDFGAVYGAAHSQPEMIGYWVIPVGALGALLAYLAATAVLKASGRILLARSARPALA